MRKRNIVIIVVAAILVVIFYAIAKNQSGQYQFVAVTRGAVTEEVSVTGNTTPVQSLDLAFQTAGTITAVYKNAGDSVVVGDVITRLDTADLNAQFAQAQAGVAASQATLAKLQAGPTQQDVQVSQTALDAAEQTLANDYGGVDNAVSAAFAKATDAVRNQISPLFSNAETLNPQLTFTVNDNQVVNNATFERIQASQELNAWQTELNVLSGTSSTSTLTQAFTKSAAHLAIIENLLTTTATAVVDASNLPSATASSYKTDIATAVTEVQDAQSAITTESQSIASDNITIAQKQAALAQTLAGSTPQDIAAQRAVVAQDQANLQSVQAKLNEATLISPMNGVITTQNAKVGQVATVGQTITSIISANNLEVDAYVPETDIGKIGVGNAVDMTFDAFPNETFTGKVFYINPGETVLSGVVEYQIKVSFDQPDSRIKSGLTANLTIKAQTDNNVLILPQYAVIQNTSGTFVEVLQNGKPVQVPVTLGIRDQEGNVEVASGVTEGQQVVNIGLKAQ